MGKSPLVQWPLVLHQTVQPGDRLHACGSAPSGRGRGDIGEKEEFICHFSHPCHILGSCAICVSVQIFFLLSYFGQVSSD